MMIMDVVIWSGTDCPATLRRRLAAAGISIGKRAAQHSHRSPEPDDAIAPAIVMTSTSRRAPAAPSPPRRWIWLCGRTIPEAQATAAVLRGAYDAISCQSPDAADQLLARIQELLVPQPPVPEAATLASVSEASRRVIAQVAGVAPTSMPVLLT